MIRVSEDAFNSFLQNKNVKIIQGDWFHSFYFVDENNIKIAYKETSSWNPEIIYKIQNEYSNQESIIFITNKLNKIL